MKIRKEQTDKKQEEMKNPINKLKDRKGYIQDTLIGANTVITGDLVSDKSIRIDGKIVGNVKTNYKVLIGEKGEIKGNVSGETVTVYGCVEGDVKALKILEIMSGGKLFGDVEVQAIAIEEGGVFSGNSKMQSNMSNNE